MLGIYWTIVRGSYQQRCKYTISGFSFYKDRDVLKTVSNAYDGAFLEKAKKIHIILEKSNILKISVKKKLQ